jgi:hypothetical protein
MHKILLADKVILEEMSDQNKTELILYFFKNCLFNVTMDKIEMESVVCKSKGSR